ncbi:hypothetical protein AQI94_30815 [Streptomyces pseudovenezuelae]|uniref:Uncharacterized protein n=1 Tax=Streptomyces pseudovenezuelae TaxID=67350 RepID=A0A117PPQ6_9ACTN|nr:hypothetical protein AQI94_30815 [Streptomyces pseudovenezuelae]
MVYGCRRRFVREGEHGQADVGGNWPCLSLGALIRMPESRANCSLAVCVSAVATTRRGEVELSECF